MTHTLFRTAASLKAHMGQSKVNVPKAWPKKTVFFRPEMTSILERGAIPGCWALI
jgi:hypothetical protein